MKNLILHYVVLMLPLVAIIAYFRDMYSGAAISLIVAWSLFYAPWLNGLRLYKRGVVTNKRDAWRACSDPKYLKDIYMKW